MKNAKRANQFLLGNITAEELMYTITSRESDYIMNLIDDITNEVEVFLVLWNWAIATLKSRNALTVK